MSEELEEFSFHERIQLARTEIGGIEKSRINPFHKSNYFDINDMLDTVNPILVKYDILLTQPIQDGKVITMLQDLCSQESVESWLDLPQESNPQKVGSCVTYYRRFTLQSLLALSALDDDGEKASVKPPLLIKSEAFNKAIDYLKTGGTIERIKQDYTLNEIVERELKRHVG